MTHNSLLVDNIPPTNHSGTSPPPSSPALLGGTFEFHSKCVALLKIKKIKKIDYVVTFLISEQEELMKSESKYGTN